MRTLYRKGLIAASVSAVLFLGGLPGNIPWQDGLSAIGQAYAAGGGHAAGGSGGGHDTSSHGDDSHDVSHSSHDDGHDDSHEDDGHDSSEGKKGKGPRYRGGRVGSSQGKGGPAQAVVEKIFENENE